MSQYSRFDAFGESWESAKAQVTTNTNKFNLPVKPRMFYIIQIFDGPRTLASPLYFALDLSGSKREVWFI
jgi:hypothetical protein